MSHIMHYKAPLELVANASENPSSPTNKINTSVILLHGLGADGHDFAPIVQKLNLPNVRFILPHAPEMAVTRNSGYIMPAWYDLYNAANNTLDGNQEDEAGIKTTQAYIHTLIQKELDRGVPAARIVIAGFSQGGAIALYTALRYPQKLAGILALSTYLPIKAKLASEANAVNAHIPIFMAHGVLDDVITLERCKISLHALQSLQYAVNWHEYNMAHSVCLEEIADIHSFLKQVLA